MAPYRYLKGIELIMKNETRSVQNKRPQLEYLNFARVVMTLLIVLYHSSGYLLNGAGTQFFEKIAASALGPVGVAAFFTLSGMTIKYNNSEVKIVGFYKKRFLSIYPSFWIVWGLVYLSRVISAKSFFYNGNKWSILLSFCGLDGYLGGAYYCVGEWFLGAIIIMYVLYPLLLWLFIHAKVFSSMMITMVYYVIISKDLLGTSGFRNIVTCVMSFWIGMLLADCIEKIVDNWVLFIVLLLIIWHISTGNTPFTVYTGIVIWGTCSLGIACIIGKAIKNTIMNKIISYLAKICFQIFLLHHVVQTWYAGWMGNRLEVIWIKWFYEISSLIIIVACASLVWHIDRIIKERLKNRYFEQEEQTNG